MVWIALVVWAAIATGACRSVVAELS